MSHTTLKTANKKRRGYGGFVRPLCQWSIGDFCFAPRLIPTLATLLVLPILISLGYWQVNRAEQKRELQAMNIKRSHANSVDFDTLNLTNTKDLQFLPIKVSGHFDNQHQFLLDNQIYQRRVGYQVITPFILANKKDILLINRGWIPRGATREQLPTIQPIQGEQTLTGVIHIQSKKPFMLSNHINEQSTNWPMRIQAVDFAQMAKLLNQPIYPLMLMLGDDQASVFQYNWQPINMKPEKHLGYAFQWFALAFVLFIIFIVVNTQRKRGKQ